MSLAKTNLAQAVSEASGECQSSGFSNRRASEAFNRELSGSQRLVFMEGIAPESRFSWFEEIKAGFDPKKKTPVAS